MSLVRFSQIHQLGRRLFRFSGKRRIIIGSFALLVLAALTLTTHILVTRARNNSAVAQPPLTATAPVALPTATPPPGPDTELRPGSPAQLRRGMLPASLHTALQALGDRLERGGRERIEATGTLRLGNDETPFVLRQDLSGRLHLTISGAGAPRILTFDGTQARGNGGTVTPAEYALLETLLYDGAEPFLLRQARDGASRPLGRRFRDPASGAFYDVFETTDTVRLGAGSTTRLKSYSFNSESHLLESVRYRTIQGNAETAVEIRLSQWRDLGGQRVPGVLERRENNSLVLRAQFTNLQLVPGPEATGTAGS